MIRDYMKANKLDCNCLKKAHAKKFLKLVQNSTDPYVRGFNNVVGGGSSAVRKWAQSDGKDILADEASALGRAAGKAGGVVRYAKYAGKVVKVLLIGEFVFLASANGLQAATEETMRDLIFADEVLGGGKWLVETTENFLKPLGHDACCRRNGLAGLLDDEE